MKNMNKLLKQAQQMQSQMLKTQSELEHKEVEATSGGGMVTVVVNGKFELLKLKIDPEAVDPDDIEMLQDLIIAAVSEANHKARALVESEMGKLTGGLNIPGLF